MMKRASDPRDLTKRLELKFKLVPAIGSPPWKRRDSLTMRVPTVNCPFLSQSTRPTFMYRSEVDESEPSSPRRDYRHDSMVYYRHDSMVDKIDLYGVKRSRRI